jgi:hypothetical protein
MIRKIFGMALLSLLVISCGTGNDKSADKSAASEEAVAAIEFAQLTADPASYTGKEIAVSGKVVHVCAHSGKKMFIVGDDPDIRLFITVGEELPKVPMELLGSEVVVTGKLTVAEKGEMGGPGEEAAGEACETEEALAAQPVLAEYVLHYSGHTVK